MGLSGVMETKQKAVKHLSVTPATSPLFCMGSSVTGGGQANPLGLTVVRASQGQKSQLGSGVRSCSWYKTQFALTVEAKHLN